MTTDEMTKIKNGSAAASMISAGIGAFTIGLLTTLAEAVGFFHDILNFYNPVGPLSGKTGVGIVVWLISWLVMNNLWKNQDRDLSKAFRTTLVLIGLGLLLTFPPIFTAFVAE